MRECDREYISVNVRANVRANRTAAVEITSVARFSVVRESGIEMWESESVSGERE